MDIINLSSYTHLEKKEIFKRHLFPKALLEVNNFLYMYIKYIYLLFKRNYFYFKKKISFKYGIILLNNFNFY